MQIESSSISVICVLKRTYAMCVGRGNSTTNSNKSLYFVFFFSALQYVAKNTNGIYGFGGIGLL